MTAPVSYTVLSAIADRLKLIDPANGFNTDAGDRVFLGFRRVNPDQLEIGPVLHVYDTEDEPDELTAFGDEAVHVTLRVMVDAFIRDIDGEGLKLAHLVAQDVFNSVLDVSDRTLGGLSLDIGYAGRSVEYPQPGGDTIAVSLEFTTLIQQPYGSI